MHTSIPGAIGTLFGLDMAVKQYIEENVSEKEEKNFCGTKVLIRKVSTEFFIGKISGNKCKGTFVMVIRNA